jgi:hypothetical protein
MWHFQTLKYFFKQVFFYTNETRLRYRQRMLPGAALKVYVLSIIKGAFKSGIHKFVSQ